MKIFLISALFFSSLSFAMSYDDAKFIEQEGRHHHQRRHGQTCQQTRSGNGYEFYKTGPIFNDTPYRKVWDGATLRVIAYEPIYYMGKRSEGVKFEVINNEPDGAGPGEILWEYKALFHCQ